MIPDAVVKRLARAQSVDPMIVDLDHALGVILWAFPDRSSWSGTTGPLMVRCLPSRHVGRVR